MMTGRQALTRIALPIVVLFAGLGAAMVLVKTAPKAERAKRVTKAPVVTVVQATTVEQLVEVAAVGRVTPAETSMLQAEVPGRVAYLHPKLVVGGLLSAGEVAVRLDDAEYKLHAAKAQAQIERARFELAVETGRRVVADKEWELLDQTISTSDDGKSMALRKPHQRLARANLAAAKSGLGLARLNVERTEITVPFNAFVKAESVAPDLLATPQVPLATLIGTDVFWVEVVVSLDKLDWLDLPGVRGVPEDGGASAQVRVERAGSEPIRRVGKAVRLVSELDQLGAQARVIVAIEDPLGLADGATADALPLLLGSFAHVTLQGRKATGVEVPRVAFRDGTSVWVLTDDNTLDIRTVAVLWEGADAIIVREGVVAGERVITSRLATPVQGMKLRLPGEEPAGEGDSADAAEPGASDVDNTMAKRRQNPK